MIGCITVEAQAAQERARQAREGLTGPVFTGKGRKRREREARYRMPPSDAHDAAEGAIGHLMGGHDGGDCEPAAGTPDMGKGYEGIGVSDGPGHPVMPGQISPQDFGRGYIQAGHGAPSPGYQGPNHPHIDLRSDRGMVRSVNPLAPAAPVEGPAR